MCWVGIASGFNLQKEYKKPGIEEEKSNCGPTVGTELFMLPTLRTDDKERREGGRDATVNSNL